MLRFPLALPQALRITFLFALLLLLISRWPAAFRRTECLLARFAGRPTLGPWLLFLSVIAIRVFALPFLPVPVPGIHDEFSYLLMGNTFAHGRLANPPHPMWISFETFHVNWFPTYSSIYPPAQGAVLALGQLLGHPWIGVLLSDAAMCATIFWMLQAWLPSRWALLGAVLAAVKLGTASYWMNSYWGGAVASAAGALILGALARLFRRPHIRDALLLGLGIAILANSRPYEGFLFCLPVAAALLWFLAGKTKSSATPQERAKKVLAPLLIVLVLTAAFMGYYNLRLTGNPLLLPHVLNSRTYISMGLFLWDHPRPPLHYRNPQFEDFHNGWERDNYQNTWSDVWRVSDEKITRFASAYFWWGALLLVPGLPWAFRDKKMRLPLVMLLLVTVGVFAVIWSNAHYAAPLTGVIFLFLVQAIRHVRTMRLARIPWGIAASWAIVILLIFTSTCLVAHGVCDPIRWTCQGDPSRAVIAQKLSHSPGKHLIMVRYDADHNIHDEWVYNGAEIDTAKVLWARDLDAEQNAKLFAYFKDRQIWLVQPDTDNTELLPYSPPDNP